MQALRRDPSALAVPLAKKARLEDAAGEQNAGNNGPPSAPGVDAGGAFAPWAPPDFEETDWGNEEDDLELLNFTQRLFENNELNPTKEPDPWAATEANDAKNAIADRIESQDDRGELLQLRSKMKSLEQQNQTMLTENYGYKGEITLLRRQLNKLNTSRQLELLNKMQEVRLKDQDQASRKDKAELEAARSRLKFLTIELESLKQKMKETKSPRNSSLLSGSGSAASARVIKQQTTSWLSPASRKSSAVKWSSEEAKETQTYSKDFTGETKNLALRENILRRVLNALVKLELTPQRSDEYSGEDTQDDSPVDLSKFSTWRFVDRSSVLNTITDYLSRNDFNEPEEIVIRQIQGPQLVEQLNLDDVRRKCANYLHTMGAWRVITYAGYEINKIVKLQLGGNDKEAARRTATVLKLLSLAEHLFWAARENGREESRSWPEWQSAINEWVFQLVETIWTTLHKRQFSRIRLRSLRLVNAALVQDLYQPTSSNYDHLLEVIVAIVKRRRLLLSEDILNILEILSIVATFQDERIYDFMCTAKQRANGANGPCLIHALANCVLDAFNAEAQTSRKLLLFEGFTALARKLQRTVSTDAQSTNPSTTAFREGSPWLASCHWEDDVARKCQCRKAFCAVGINLVSAVWKMWAAEMTGSHGFRAVEMAAHENEQQTSQSQTKTDQIGSSDANSPNASTAKKHQLEIHKKKTTMFDHLSYLSRDATCPADLSELHCQNSRCREMLMKKLSNMVFEKYPTDEERDWMSSLKATLVKEGSADAVVEPHCHIDQALLQGLLFLDSISEYTRSLSLAYGTFGYIPIMEAISLYEKYCSQLPLIQQLGGAECVEDLTMLDRVEEGVVVDRFEYPTGAQTVVHQSAGGSDDENLQLQDDTKPITSFGDPDWPPKLSLLQNCLTDAAFSESLANVEDELIFPSV